MDSILAMQNQHWQNIDYGNILVRDGVPAIESKLVLKEILILQGVRRSGKSTIFRLLINALRNNNEAKSILYINLDDPFYAETWQDAKQIYKIVERAEKLTGIKTQFLFLDEIQNVFGWEHFIKSAYDNNVYQKIFLTGSNSFLLSSDYASLLSGRYTNNYVYPLSYSEILHNNGINSNLDLVNQKSLALRLLETMLYYGSFPEVYKNQSQELKRDLLLNYYESIVLRDCIKKRNVRNIRLLQNLAQFLLTNTATLYSYNKLAKNLQNNENTIQNFIGILVESFLLDEIRSFSYSLKQQPNSKKKIYVVDNGLIQAVAANYSPNTGKFFENLVFTELKKMQAQEISFYSNNKECDFIVKSGSEIFALQACYEINAQNRERELNGLQAAMNEYQIKQGYVVTFDQEERINDQIAVVPFAKMFFGQNSWSQL